MKVIDSGSGSNYDNCNKWQKIYKNNVASIERERGDAIETKYEHISKLNDS